MKLATLKLIEELLVREKEDAQAEIRELNKKNKENGSGTVTYSTERFDKAKYALEEIRRYDFT